MKKIVVLSLALSSLLVGFSRFHREPKRTDPRYAEIIADQLERRIDFLFIPKDINQEDSELVKNVLFPAISLIVYSGPESSTREDHSHDDRSSRTH